MKIRPLHTDEQKYTYRQSTQIEGQTGSIGYLRGDFGAGGKEFFSSWFDHRRDLKQMSSKALWTRLSTPCVPKNTDC